MLTIAMGLTVITVVASALYNMNQFTRKLPERFFVVAYLKDGVGDREAQEIITSLKGRPMIDKVKYVSKAEALKELKASMKDAEYILEGMNDNPLPSSIEVRFKKEAVGPESIRASVDQIKKMKGIEDVQYGEKFLLSIHSIKTGMETIGLVLTVAVVSGIIFICYSTVKLLFYRKKEEVETLKLLGATRGFIRLPFMIEGGVIGILGGMMSMAVALAFYYSVFFKLSATVPVIRAIVFPSEILISLPLVGLFLGITGSVIAMGRIKFS